MKGLIFLIILGPLSPPGFSQGYKTLEEKTLNIKSPGVEGTFTVMNINGQVKVLGTERNDIRISYKLEAKPTRRGGLEQAQEDLSFDIEYFDDSIAAVLNAPFVQYHSGGRHMNINSNHMDYWFICDIEVEVPKSLNLNLATVNDGGVIVNNINGKVVADNVNGDVRINGVEGIVITETVNGDIKVDFLKNPGNGSRFQTINGNIKTNVPDDLSATIAFKSMNGEFFTDFDYMLGPSGKIVENTSHKRGTQYRVERLTKVTVGSGESSLFYETLNGNMYLRKQN